MITLFVTALVTTAVACVLATAITSIAIKNRIVVRQQRRLLYWQRRALETEKLLQNQHWR